MSTDTSLITFKAISNFTNELGDVFSETQRPLKLYTHLIKKTTIAHDKPIQKHIDAFRLFCVSNRDAIANKNDNGLSKHRISYSKSVFIDMKEIFQHSDPDTKSVIWKHLLTISALVDPTGQAKKILKEQAKSGGDEVNFLTDIISKVEEKVDPNSNPMEAVASIMKSGIFTDLVDGMGKGLQNGSLDLGKLMGTVQKMVTKLGDDTGNHEGGEQAMNMINTMMGSLSAGAKSPSNDGQPQPMPDLAGMLGPMMGAMMGGSSANGMPNLAGMMGMMGGVGASSSSSSNSIEDQINRQLEAAKTSGKLPVIEEKNDC